MLQCGRIVRWPGSPEWYYEISRILLYHLRQVVCIWYFMFHTPVSCSLLLILLSDRYEKQYAWHVNGHIPCHRSHKNKLHQEPPMVWDNNLDDQLSEFAATCPLCLSRIHEISAGVRSSCTTGVWVSNLALARTLGKEWGLNWSGCFSSAAHHPSCFLPLVQREWLFIGYLSVLPQECHIQLTSSLTPRQVPLPCHIMILTSTCF